MKELNGDMLRRLSVIRNDYSREICSLYESSLDTLQLGLSDYITIRDLVNINGNGPRALHALLLCMFSLLEEGSLCLSLEKDSLAERLRSFTDAAGEIAIEIRKSLKNWPELIYKATADQSQESSPEQYKPMVLSADGSRLYFHKYYHFEKLFKQQVRRFIQHAPGHVMRLEQATSMLYSVLVKNPLYINGAPAFMNREQVMALVLPLLRNFVIISGGPGTGKTSIVLNILRVFARKGMLPGKMVLAAPTGRAAQRLSDSLVKGLSSLESPSKEDSALETVQGMTIHRLLKYSPRKNEFIHNEHNRLDADLVIVDEVSMVDLVLLAQLLLAVDEKSTVVLLGDKNQLPSVGAGAVLTDLMPDNDAVGYSAGAIWFLRELFPNEPDFLEDLPIHEEDPLSDRFVLLKESFRSEKGILEIAERINRQDAGAIDYIAQCRDAKDLPASGICRMIPPEDPDQMAGHFERVLMCWADALFMQKQMTDLNYGDLVRQTVDFDPGTYGSNSFEHILEKIMETVLASRIVAPVKSGRYGTVWINRFINSYMAGRLDQKRQNADCFHGCPVILTRNDYTRDLFNGDMGVVLKSHEGAYYAFFKRPRGFSFYPLNTLVDFEPAWAITVHKSQGSEYERVLMVISEHAGRLLTKEILYTGITRARALVVIYGTDTALVQALSARIERVSGIAFDAGDNK